LLKILKAPNRLLDGSLSLRVEELLSKVVTVALKRRVRFYWRASPYSDA